MKKALRELLRYLMLTLGAIFYALGIALLLNPLSLAPGGLSGISIIINSLTGLPTGIMFFTMNIPIMIIAWVKFGFRFFSSTIYVLAVSSGAIEIIRLFTHGAPVITENPLLAGLAGGILTALGIGTVFRAGGTTGGVDIIVKLIRMKYKHINTGTIFFLVDMAVIAVSAIAFKNLEIALYAAIAVFVNSRVLDFVLYGLNRSKLVYIISDKPTELSYALTHDLDLGATVLKGEGAYTGKPKNLLMCAVKNPNFPKLRKTVKDIDGNAFMIVSDTTEIFGEGYKAIDKEDL